MNEVQTIAREYLNAGTQSDRRRTMLRALPYTVESMTAVIRAVCETVHAESSGHPALKYLGQDIRAVAPKNDEGKTELVLKAKLKAIKNPLSGAKRVTGEAIEAAASAEADLSLDAAKAAIRLCKTFYAAEMDCLLAVQVMIEARKELDYSIASHKKADQEIAMMIQAIEEESGTSAE